MFAISMWIVGIITVFCGFVAFCAIINGIEDVAALFGIPAVLGVVAILIMSTIHDANVARTRHDAITVDLYRSGYQVNEVFDYHHNTYAYVITTAGCKATVRVMKFDNHYKAVSTSINPGQPQPCATPSRAA